ncbi:MAG: TM1812 family CRISPR-associated protein, partial [Pseudanabaenaceae cyanobacterium]
MHLLTFLGTGKYQATRYVWQGEEWVTPYVGQALQHFLKADRLSVFVTPEAKAMHWEALQGAIAQTCVLEAIDIPMGESEAEIWEIFAAVVRTVSPGAEIAFDITHAFRSIPLLVVLAGGFLQKARGVRLRGTYYGAFNPARKDESTP